MVTNKGAVMKVFKKYTYTLLLTKEECDSYGITEAQDGEIEQFYNDKLGGYYFSAAMNGVMGGILTREQRQVVATECNDFDAISEINVDGLV
jgi:hypothetical protein